MLLALEEPTAVYGPGIGGLFTALAVLAVMAAGAWLLRRGSFGVGALRRQRPGGISVETAFSLGERRSLAIVSVEGRRLVLGLTPGQISLITELAPPAEFSAALARRQAGGDTQ
jgi:flagellar protein FliO/FliZ